MTLHLEWLRNNPKGPHGPIPQRAPKAPLGPFATLGSLWSLLAPCPWVPWSLGGWDGGGVPGLPLGPRDRHLVEATLGGLEILVAERRCHGENALGRRGCALA